MLKIKTGTSTNSQASMAGKEAAAQVKENLQDMKMAFVYSGVQYDQKELLENCPAYRSSEILLLRE